MTSKGVPESGQSLEYVRAHMEGTYVVVKHSDLKSMDTGAILDAMVELMNIDEKEAGTTFTISYAFEPAFDTAAFLQHNDDLLNIKLCLKHNTFFKFRSLTFTSGGDV